MAERQEFSFTPNELGIVSTEEVIETGENFLNSDPNEIKFIPKTPVKKQDEEEDEEVTEDRKKKDPKKIKEVVELSREIEGDDLLNALEEKSEETAEEDEPISVKKKEEVSKEEDAVVEEEVNVYSSIAGELLNQGIFNLGDSEETLEIDTPEQLLERFQLEARKAAADTIDKFLDRFGDDYKDMFENVFIKGINPKDYLNRYTKIQGVKDLDLTDENNQEKVVRELYKSEGKSSEYIEKRITQLKNYNDIHDEAVEAQRVLIEREESAIQNEAEKRQVQETNKQRVRTEYMTNVSRILNDKLKSKEFDGIPVDRKFAEETLAYVTQERFQTPDKQLLTTFDKDVLDLSRPENHEMKIKVAMLLQILKEDPTLTRLAKRAVSKETSNLFGGLRKTAIKAGTNIKEDSRGTQPSSFFS